ncbi:transposase mutator type [[Leptolyngbya] sp. PCC 7376]|nr:transposase mutator type [[Leptolyngbya] sp. PCC 7376]
MKKQNQTSRADELIDELLQDCPDSESILGESGLLQQLSKRLIERALQGELSHHLNQVKEAGKQNSRNGYSKKTIKSTQGEMDISIPRDRKSEFEPLLVPKGQRRIQGLEEKILALYSRGMSTRDIQAQMQELYGVEISAGLVSEVTSAVMEEIKAWQHRPLEEIYPILWLDGMRIKIREEGRDTNQTLYLALGVKQSGHKEVLGMWLSSGGEGAKFWLSVLNEIHHRGVEHICIACVDGLKGFPAAIEAVFPKTRVQLCIVHLIRNSLKFVSWKDRKSVVSDLKPIYQAATVSEAESALTAFAERWDGIYPTISQIWLNHWENIIPLFDDPAPIRRIIYTTNAIEAVNRSLGKV